MKVISCIQQYVIDNLINNRTLSIENLIDAIVKTCSTEQVNNILTILIKTQTSCTNKDKVNFVKMKLHLYCENQYQLCGAYILGAHINKPISQQKE